MSELPAADYDTGTGTLVRSKLTDDGWTETGSPTDVPAGVRFVNATFDGYYRPWTETDSIWLIESELDAVFGAATIRMICGLHPVSSAGLFEFVVLQSASTSTGQSGGVVVDGRTSNFIGPVENDFLFSSVGDVFRSVIIARMATAPRNVMCYLHGPNGVLGNFDGALSATVRANVFLGGGHTALGLVQFWSAPVAITRVRRWDLDPTNPQVREAIFGVGI